LNPSGLLPISAYEKLKERAEQREAEDMSIKRERKNGKSPEIRRPRFQGS
jgi:hypothetical protein